MLRGELKRVEAKPVMVPVLLNDKRVELPAIHAKGRLGDQDTEFYFLDDPENPLTLKFRLGDQGSLDVIKISFPSDKPNEQPIERTLETAGRAEVYGIYFDFASAAIRPESEPVLKEIAGALKDHPDWKLGIEGHTDGVGGDTDNLELSKKRAAAVKDALVARYQITAARLSTAGFGKSRPKESNDTIAGRARNRRVELVRQ
jgi:outer membrane protein OmpA-like peptidoglycan-associated protein